MLVVQIFLHPLNLVELPLEFDVVAHQQRHLLLRDLLELSE